MSHGGNDPEFGTAGGCAEIHGRVMSASTL
jgi:hypothetical protein